VDGNDVGSNTDVDDGDSDGCWPDNGCFVPGVFMTTFVDDDIVVFIDDVCFDNDGVEDDNEVIDDDGIDNDDCSGRSSNGGINVG
jgi:hypothetical protein